MRARRGYGIVKDSEISFLDVMIERNAQNHLETSVYRKKTNNNIYINWNAHSPKSWKIGTLRNLVKRALRISSTDEKLQTEIEHIKKSFCEINDYPANLVQSTINDELRKHQQQNENTNNEGDDDTNNENDDDKEEKIIQLNLPYAGYQGEILTKKLKRSLEAKSENLNIRLTYKPSKLGSRFKIKDKTKHEHHHNVCYQVSCGNQKCTSTYIGQTKRRIGVRIDEHSRKDEKSHILTHSKETKHKRVSMKNVKILGNGYRSLFKRRISEAIFIKEHNPDLNIQEESFKLSLYN